MSASFVEDQTKDLAVAIRQFLKDVSDQPAVLEPHGSLAGTGAGIRTEL
jgi:hypothetical protein